MNCILYLAVRLMNFVSAVFSLLISLCFSVKLSQLYNSDGMVHTLYIFNRLRLLCAVISSTVLSNVSRVLVFVSCQFLYGLKVLNLFLLFSFTSVTSCPRASTIIYHKFNQHFAYFFLDIVLPSVFKLFRLCV
jgi:hypothetical protein